MNKKILILLSLFTLYTFSWDYSLFVQVWPGAWLYDIKSNYTFTNDYFTVHGLWPQYWNGSWPQYCNTTEKFNVTQVEPIYDNLTLYWTNFEDPVNFWDHEFFRHLECYEDINPDTYVFFWYGLDFRSNLNIYQALLQSDIVPSNDITYDINKIYKSINDYFGTKVVITCDQYKILTEVRFCMTKEFELFDCPDNEYKEACQLDSLWYNLV